MTSLAKWLLLLSLLLLAWALPSRATFHVGYLGPLPATVYLDDHTAFTLTRPWYSTHTVRLWPGIHGLTLRQGQTVVKTRFVYFHLNSTVVEYGRFQGVPGLALAARWHLGKFLWE